MMFMAAASRLAVGGGQGPMQGAALELVDTGKATSLAKALVLMALVAAGCAKSSSTIGSPASVSAPTTQAPAALAPAHADGALVAASAPSAVGPVATSTASGPTPFPDPQDERAWPGKGAIRVFPYMNDNRKWFWTEREAKQRRIVFAGDSLIGGWQDLEADLKAFPVLNRGIGGEPTRGLLFRFQEDVLDLHPRAIVLLTGTNDLSAQQDVHETRSNIDEMLNLAERRSPGVPIVVCTLPPRKHPDSPVDPKQLLAANDLIRALPQSHHQVIVLDLYALLADPDGSPHAEYFGSDHLHLAEPGFLRFRDGLVPIFERLHLG